MNTSDSSSHFITRRDFMKKSALTVGAITLLSQGIGLAAGSGSSNEWWDMRCVAPALLNDQAGDTYEKTMPGCDPTTYTFEILTTKLADEENVGYNSISFEHRYSLWVAVEGGSTAHVEGSVVFDSVCDINTGVITTSYSELSSDPQQSGPVISKSVDVTIQNLYDATLTINIVRSAAGAVASTEVWASVSWREKAAPHRTGNYRFPEISGSFGMINEFVPQKH